MKFDAQEEAMSVSATVARDWYADVPRATRAPTVAGIVIMAVTFIVFGIWSNTAMIAGAVLAPVLLALTSLRASVVILGAAAVLITVLCVILA